nr:reverse transcriptase domain-containing protein [Tanacetum cinerariifolium]
MEFEVGDMVMLKVSPWKGVIHFGKHGKLSPWYIGPFEILERIGPVAYKLELPEKLLGIHNTFHVSNLKKCLADENIVILLEEIQLDDKLHFIEELMEIMDRETSNTLHNAIMETGGKDRQPMLEPGNYVQWKSRIKRYIDTKPNRELIHYCLKNLPYKYTWADKVVLISEGSSETTTERAERLARTANPLTLVAQQQPVYHPQNHATHYTQNSSTRSQQVATRNRGKAIVNSPPPIYDQEPSMVAEDDEMSKDKEIDKLMALISLSFKKIYKPTNNNLRTSSNTSRANQDNSPRINRSTGYDNQRIEQADWRDGTDDEPKDQELEAHYMYMAQIQEVTPDAVDNSGPIFDTEPLQKVPNNDHYNEFSIEIEHPEQSKFVNDTYPIEQDKHTVIIDSLDMSYDRQHIDQNDDDDDLANERDLLASLIEKLKCEIDDSKNCNKFLETSNKTLVDKLKREIADFKTKNKSLESSNNHLKEGNNELSKTNELMYNDLKKLQAELDRRNDVKNEKRAFYTSRTISILSQAKVAQIKLYKTHEDNELDKVIALENKVKVLDTIVYKTDQSVQTINMLNSKCKTSFAKPEFLKKAKRANPRLYDIEKWLDESIPYDQKCKSSKELFKIKRSVSTIFDGVERCKQMIVKRTYYGHIVFIQNTIEENFCLEIRRINADLEKFHLCFKEEMVADLRYFNSLKLEVESLKSQLETQKTQFLNEINRFSREYYYADHMNAIVGVYTELDEDTNLQCDYLETLDKCECLEKDLSKSKMMSKSFEALQKHAINLELDLQQCQEKIKNDKSLQENQSREFAKNVNNTLKFKT